MSAASAESSLLCPFTQEWFVDPVTLHSCCGKSVSRAPLIAWLATHTHCFLCNANLAGIFDPTKAARSVELGHLADEARAREEAAAAPEDEKKQDGAGAGAGNNGPWKAKIVRLANRNQWVRSTVGRLTIAHAGQANGSFKTHLASVCDKSGSMEAETAPGKSIIAQAQFAMRCVVDATYANPNLETTLIAYDNHATSIRVDKRQNQPALYYNWIARLSDRMGGTTFQSAFNELLDVADAHLGDQSISSLCAVFMTDGDDQAARTQAQRVALVGRFKTELSRRWNRKVVIHTVGFGADHDFEFLDLLRKAGSEEGTFAFADPSKSNDALSSKMNQLLEAIQQGSSVPIALTSGPRVLAGADGEYWVDLTGTEPDTVHTLDVSLALPGVAAGAPDRIHVVAEELDDDSQMRALYHGHLIDQLAAEVMELSKRVPAPASAAAAAAEAKESDKPAAAVLTKDALLHIELALMRARHILASLDPAGPDVARLTNLVTMLGEIKAGHTLDQMELADMRFQGRYAGQQQQGQQPQQAPIGHKFMCGFLPTQSIVQARVPRGQWTTHPYAARFTGDADRTAQPEVFRRLLHDSNDVLLPWLETEKATWPAHRTGGASNATAFLAAASIGRVVAVKAMAAHLQDLDTRDSNSLNALDLAILHGYTGSADPRPSTAARLAALRAKGVEILGDGRRTFGYWKTYDMLRALGLRPTLDGNLLLRSSLSRGFYDIAERLVRGNTRLRACKRLPRFPLSPHLRKVKYRLLEQPCMPMRPASCGGLGEKESERAAW
jgi:hypothetical protein